MPARICVPVENSMEFIETKEVTPLITKVSIKVCYVSNEPNRNGSIITKGVAEKWLAPSLRGSPIVGYYDKDTQDFDGHTRDIQIDEDGVKFIDMTKPYGFVDLNAKVWFQSFNEDGINREYLCTDGYVWTDIYPEARRILKNSNNQSMELTDIEGNWTKLSDEHEEIFIMNKAIIEKLCILGEDIEPCFEGAKITVNFSLQDCLENLSFMVKDILNKGGYTQMDYERMYNELKAEFDALKNETNEKNIHTIEEMHTKYADYDQIKDKLFTAESELEELQNSFSAEQQKNAEMETELNILREFKINYDKAMKKNMIDSFYMLSDTDKKDVIDNIDSYSLDEIEAKLSIICVRNKVDFNIDAKDEGKLQKKDEVVFSLASVIEEEDSAPAWVMAIKEKNKER